MPVNPALMDALLGQSQSAAPMQGGGMGSPLMQQASVQETRVSNPNEAQAVVKQLQQQGFQAYVVPLPSGGQHVIRFWPLNPNQ